MSNEHVQGGYLGDHCIGAIFSEISQGEEFFFGVGHIFWLPFEKVKKNHAGRRLQLQEFTRVCQKA